MDSVVHFSYPRLILCLNLMPMLWLGENFIYLFISPNSYLLSELGRGWRMHLNEHCISQNPGSAIKRGGRELELNSREFIVIARGRYWILWRLYSLTFLLGFSSSLYRSQCYALHWRQTAASSAPRASNGTFDDGLNHNELWMKS